jgi:predicted HTH domain antitoxin
VPEIRIECPKDVLGLPGQSQATLEQLAREAMLVRLYGLGQLSSGRAAEILGVSRRAFLDLLSEYGVSVFDEQVDLENEARCGRD